MTDTRSRAETLRTIDSAADVEHLSLQNKVIDWLATKPVLGWLGDKWFAAISYPAARKQAQLERVEAETNRLQQAVGQYVLAESTGYKLSDGNKTHIVAVRPYKYDGAAGHNVLIARRTEQLPANITPRTADLVITTAPDSDPLFIENGKPVGFHPIGASHVLDVAASALEAATQGAGRQR